jgi:nucleotide-binding universal stress UspA family protein
MFKNILLATDGSAASEHAARLAVQLARENGAKLTALYVVDPYPYLGIGEANPLGFQAYMSAAAQHAAEAHGKILALCQGEPGRSGVARLMLGSVASKVVAESPVPVLVAR